MKSDIPITNNQWFKDCGGVLLCSMIGGSTLYQLNNENSDIDYRGIYVATNPLYISGFKNRDSIVTYGEMDATYYEIGHYLRLLNKTNTQIMEILFASDDAFQYKHPIMDEMRANRDNLFNSFILGESLKGYVYSEMRLAIGERQGRLGSNRKEAIENYGFSPKNFVQILRLCAVGKHMFQSGQYMVSVKDTDPSLHTLLMDIKNNPERYSKEELTKMVDSSYDEMVDSIKKSTIRREFDMDFAANLILKARNLK